MSKTYYSEDHEWIEVEGDIGTIGVTNFAQEQLGDVVFVELPEVGDSLDQGGEAGVVESVKAASEVYAPVSGEVTEVNDDLADNPGMVNDEPEDGAWFFKLKLSDPAELDDLMDAAAYKKFCKDQA
ncbi:glycine cleavage system protein GcvH [Marivibrio halodurans]|uniref:Glycine cleavage system H protein n=1 Tax=Marivibrio halodurans TaxID=2039722 RepID=A0A8J7S1S6_9PROT|nr:glycine cleavage system protein GcvH [Marivibrio halodurans]MBP5858295.1 glycine cleavage system protein GcvH [Marivibrio halodurans]